MAIYKTAISKPITTGLIFVAVIVLGLFSLTRLPIDQMPEMDPPYVTVMTTYAGANASEIETNITKIIENSLNSVDGLKNLTSTSKDNISVVTLEFEWGSDIDEALNDIRSYVDLLYDNLPDGVSRPMILKLNSSAMPILVYGFTAKESYSGLDRILEDNVVNVLNRVDGIGNYYNVSVGYNHGATRLQLGYGKQREGLLCIGGVCRQVPASNGLTFSLTTSF